MTLTHKCVGFGAPTRSATKLKSMKGPQLRVIDAHCHILSDAAELAVCERPEKKREPELLALAIGEASAAHNAVMMNDLHSKLTTLEVRLADMDAMGVDIQVLSPSPTQYYYWADRELSKKVVDLQNQDIAEACERFPERFAGLAAVSLQFPDLAVAQLEHCIRQLGFKGVEISSVVAGVEIANEKFAPFWRKAEELGAVVFLHPLGSTLGPRANQHYLANLIGVPLETTIALSHLVFGGVLDRHPGLKILAAHGGGYFSHYRGRFDHGRRVRPECQGSSRAPSDYLRQLYFDTIVHDERQLTQLADAVGVDRLIIGTDYPFDMGEFDPIDLIDRALDDPCARKKVLSENASTLFQLL